MNWWTWVRDVLGGGAPLEIPVAGIALEAGLTIELDERGVRRLARGAVVESVAWEDLTAVTLLTTDWGPFYEDVFWLLADAEGRGVCLPGSELNGDVLLDALGARCPGLAYEQVIAAMTSTDWALFPVWQAGPSTAEEAAEEAAEGAAAEAG